MAKQREVKQEEAVVEVSRTVLGQTTSSREKIKIRPFTTDTANVGVNYGVTLQVGDGRFIKVNVSVFCPCYVEEVQDMFQQVSKMADEMMDTEVQRLSEKE